MAAKLRHEGNLLLKNGKTEQALIKYSQALSLNPDDAKLYANRSLCYLKLRQKEQSLDDASKAVKLNPKWFKAWFRRAEAFKSLSNWRCAIMAYYKSSISLDICNDHKMKRFVQKQMINAQLSYLKHCNEANQMKTNQILKSMQCAFIKHRKNISKKEERKDKLRRIQLFEQSIKENDMTSMNGLKCKEFYGFINPNEANEPNRCYGDGMMHWNLMNKAITFEKNEDLEQRILQRHNEWIQSGLCHVCQYFIFEREEQTMYLKRHKPASLNDFDWD